MPASLAHGFVRKGLFDASRPQGASASSERRLPPLRQNPTAKQNRRHMATNRCLRIANKPTISVPVGASVKKSIIFLDTTVQWA